MRPGILVRAAGLLVILLTPVMAIAQSRNTGAIRGHVSDETSGLIPGVVVELRSPDYIGGTHALTTDKNGVYRFIDLPPGIYSLTFSIEGYQKVQRDGIVLEATRTLDVDIQLTAKGGLETVVVSGQSPLVDLASSATSTTLSADYLQNLPTSRIQVDVINLAPGINNDSAFGGGGSSANAYQIDGVDVSDPEAGTPYAFFNYNLMKESQLVALGAPAEYGGFTGVVFNSVTKSGSNDFSGLIDILNIPKGLTVRNTHDKNLQPPEQLKFYDTTAQVGGPFIKDKLWYFFSAEYYQDDRSVGGPPRMERNPRYFGKLTWQINPNNQFEAWGEFDRFDVTGSGGSSFTPLEATITEKAPEWDWNLTWRSVLSARTTLNVAYTGWYGYFYDNPASGYNLPGHVDESGFASQNAASYYLADRDRHVLNATVSHFSDTFLTGKHDFKYGVELERSRVRSRLGYPGGAYYYDYNSYNPAYSYTLAYLGYSYDLRAINNRASAFVQDSWQINDRLTINPGVRVDFNRGSVPGSANIFRTAPVAPRIGFTYDLTGKKKTVLKAHYGRYYEALFGSFFESLTPGAFSQKDVYLIPAGTPFDRNNPDPSLLLFSEVPKKLEIDRNLKQPQMDQYILGVDHDLGHEFALSATLIYRKNRNFIDTVSKNGDFTKVKGFDPRTNDPVTLFDQGNINDTLLITNPEGVDRDYRALELTATKRFSQRWQLLASYVRSRATGNIDNVDFSSSTLNNNGGGNGGVSLFLDTPNSLVNAQGHLTNDPTNQWKIQGTYVIPKVDVKVSGNYTWVTGNTWTRVENCLDTDPDPSVVDCFNFNQGRVFYYAEPRGSRRLDPTNNLDFRAEKVFKIKGTELGVYTDIFNVFNTGEDTAVNIRDGSTFGDARTFGLPRRWRFGIRYNW